MKLKLQNKTLFYWGIFFVLLTVLGIIFLPNPSGGEKAIGLTVTTASAIILFMRSFGLKILEDKMDARF